MPKSNYSIQDRVLISIALLAALYGYAFGVVVFFEGNPTLAVTDIIAGSFFLFLAIWTLFRPSQLIQRLFIVLGASAFFYYLFISGGQQQNGFIWSILVPVTSAFFLGTLLGTIVSVGYLGLLFIGYYGGKLINPLYQAIAPDTFLRFISVYIVIGLVIAVYEYNRSTDVKQFLAEISERKRIAAEKSLTEAALQQSNLMLELIMNNIPQLIFWKDSNLFYQGCNKRAANFIGISNPLEIKGRTDNNLLWHNSNNSLQNQNDLRVIKSRATELHRSEQRQLADGQIRWYDVSRVPLINEQGILTGLLISMEDITERKNLEEKISESHRQTDKINQIMSGREERIMELKREVNQLSCELGKGIVYQSMGDES
jgi:PAS domain S-box-containing protein